MADAGGPIRRGDEELIAGGGLIHAGWCGRGACAENVKEETKTTIRVIPDPEFRSDSPPESCLHGGAKAEVLWARAY